MAAYTTFNHSLPYTQYSPDGSNANDIVRVIVTGCTTLVEILRVEIFLSSYSVVRQHNLAEREMCQFFYCFSCGLLVDLREYDTFISKL